MVLILSPEKPAEPVKSKRKHAEVDGDSEDELFLAYENGSKKKVSLGDSEDAKVEEKENKSVEEAKSPVSKPADKLKEENSGQMTPKPLNKALSNAVNSPKPASSPSSVASPAQKSGKLMIQSKISFGKPAASPKPNPEEIKKKQQEVAAEIAKRPNGEWFIQDYMLDEQWKKLLNEEFEKSYFKEINNFLRGGYQKGIFRPPKELVFNAYNSTKLNDIKVVIIGQDPYHDDGQAHGLCFSVPVGVRVPPSLRNIYQELKNDIPEFERDEKLGGYLQKWTEEGVFMLNTFLTVEAHKAGSHSNIGWETFTDRTIKIISEKNNGCAFFLWGNFAQRKEPLIDKKKHKVIKCAHPSPFSATKFFGSRCFSQANTFLKSIGKEPVNWSLKK